MVEKINNRWKNNMPSIMRVSVKILKGIWFVFRKISFVIGATVLIVSFVILILYYAIWIKNPADTTSYSYSYKTTWETSNVE